MSDSQCLRSGAFFFLVIQRLWSDTTGFPTSSNFSLREKIKNSKWVKKPRFGISEYWELTKLTLLKMEQLLRQALNSLCLPGDTSWEPSRCWTKLGFTNSRKCRGNEVPWISHVTDPGFIADRENASFQMGKISLFLKSENSERKKWRVATFHFTFQGSTPWPQMFSFGILFLQIC
jgi:hypothetical protein